jgi:hypothetical protein
MQIQIAGQISAYLGSDSVNDAWTKLILNLGGYSA